MYAKAINRLMEEGEMVESFLLANAEFEMLQALCKPLPAELGADLLLGGVLSVVFDAVNKEAAKIVAMCARRPNRLCKSCGPFQPK